MATSRHPPRSSVGYHQKRLEGLNASDILTCGESLDEPLEEQEDDVDRPPIGEVDEEGLESNAEVATV